VPDAPSGSSVPKKCSSSSITLTQTQMAELGMNEPLGGWFTNFSKTIKSATNPITNPAQREAAIHRIEEEAKAVVAKMKLGTTAQANSDIEIYIAVMVSITALCSIALIYKAYKKQ
jgi:hypothetical protein